MNDVISFAVVLAINLLLLGTVIAGGLAFSFRFIESVSPRVRYIIAVFVFLLAVIIPVAVTQKAPGSIAEQHAALSAGEETTADAAVITNLDQSPVFSRPNRADEIAAFITFSPIGSIFLLIWGIGCVYFLFREAVGWVRLRRERGEWEPATVAERALLQCPKEIPLYFAKDQSPGTVGSLYPVMVLPRDWPESLSIDAKRLVVRHEAAHAKWRDPLVNSLLRIIRAFFWVSPALWIIERLIESEREAAADKAAIAAVSNEPGMRKQALVYAETLMAVAKNLDAFGGRGPTRRMIGLRGGKATLEQRVRRLLSTSRTTNLQIASSAAAFIMALAVMAVIPAATLLDNSDDALGEPAVIDSRFNETINERPEGAPPNIAAETIEPRGRATGKTPAQKATVRVRGGQNVKLAPLSPLRGQLSPLKTDHMVPLKTDHMAELAPLGPLR